MSLESTSINSTTHLTRPTTSIAALLPTETLAHISVCAFEDLSPLKRQQERFSYSRVCRSWYLAMRPGVEYVVIDADKLERLVAHLQDTKGGDRVRLLKVVMALVDSNTMLGYLRLLLKLCNYCRDFELDTDRMVEYFEYGSGEDWVEIDGEALEALWSRLESMASLKRVAVYPINQGMGVRMSISLLRCAVSPLCSFDTLIVARRLANMWPRLRFLELKGRCEVDKSSSALTLRYPQALRRLFIYNDGDGYNHSRLLVKIFHASRHTLEEVRLEILNDIDRAHLALLRTALDNSAPRLTVLELRDGTWSDDIDDDEPYDTREPILNIEAALKRAPNLRDLYIGINGVNPATIFDTLSKLEHLEKMRFGDGFYESTLRYDLCDYDSFLAFVSTAPRLRSLTIPKAFNQNWFEEDEEDAEAFVELLESHGIEVSIRNFDRVRSLCAIAASTRELADPVDFVGVIGANER